MVYYAYSRLNEGPPGRAEHRGVKTQLPRVPDEQSADLGLAEISGTSSTATALRIRFAAGANAARLARLIAARRVATRAAHGSINKHVVLSYDYGRVLTLNRTKVPSGRRLR